MPKIMSTCYALFAILLLTMTSVVIADTISKGEIKFKKGSSSTIIKGGLARGEENEYLLTARGGQTMTVSITSVENNAVFTLYASAEGDNRIPFFDNKGKEMSELTEWQGKLPGNGTNTYTILVGATRGGSSYTLKVAIK